MKKGPKPRPPIDRFLAKVDKQADGCWLWTGFLHSNGYATFYTGTRKQMAHRFAYEYYVGPIPDGLQLDHLCRVRSCVNPEHVEPVTSRTNLLRGHTVTAAHAAKTECPQGHPFDEVNTYIHPTGSRRCRECMRERDRRRYPVRQARGAFR